MDIRRFTKTFAGRERQVLAQSIGDSIWAKIEGETYVLSAPDAVKSKSKSGKMVEGLIKAPMPGKIINVFEKNGSRVKAGAPVLALEAMKMEYVLKAPIDGELTGISVNLGQQVDLGERLFEVKK